MRRGVGSGLGQGDFNGLGQREGAREFADDFAGGAHAFFKLFDLGERVAQAHGAFFFTRVDLFDKVLVGAEGGVEARVSVARGEPGVRRDAGDERKRGNAGEREAFLQCGHAFLSALKGRPPVP